MTVTKIFLMLILLGLLFIILSIPLHLYLEVFILYNLLLLLLLAVDYYKTPVNNVFEIQRLGDRKLSFLEEEQIILKIYNKSNTEASIEVLQEFPESFACNNNRIAHSIAPHCHREFVFCLMPQKRGAFLLQDIYIRRVGILSLVKKDIKVELEEEYKVYPSLRNLKRYHLMLKKDFFFKKGSHILKKKSEGSEFESLREYVKGDDVRKVNWIKSARENKLMVNQYEPEGNKHVYILLDRGRTMSFAVDQCAKLDLAINAALFLSDVVGYNKDKSGLVVFNTEIDVFIKPGKGAHHRNLVLEALYHLEGTKSTSIYEEVLFHLSKQEKRRSLICLFTDIDTLQEVDYMKEALDYTAKKHHVVIFLVKSQKLDQLKAMEVLSKKDAFLKGIIYKKEEERESIIRALGQRGVTCIECNQEDIIYKAINAYMKAKNREAI